MLMLINLLFIGQQIDNSKPSSNATVVETLLQNGTLAIQVDKFDTGSGVNKIDVFQMIGMHTPDAIYVFQSIVPIIATTQILPL